MEIIGLARAGGHPWQEFFDTCYMVGNEGTVHIHHISSPRIEEGTGQRVRAIEATLTHRTGIQAQVTFHIGVLEDEVFTGYESPEFLDYYEVTFPDGRVVGSKLWWVDPPEEDDPEDEARETATEAWRAVSPLKMAVWWATYARLIDDRPVIDSPL